jgi:hypothetical protein
VAPEESDPNKRKIPVVEADYIPPSVRVSAVPRARGSSRRQLLAYLMVAPVVAGVAGAAIAYKRYRSSGAVGHIEVNANPPDAVIFLDGKQVADRSPASLAVKAGTYELDIQRPGFVGINRQVTVDGDEIVAVSVALAVAPTAPRPPPAAHRRPPKLPAKIDGVVYLDLGSKTAQTPDAAAR